MDLSKIMDVYSNTLRDFYTSVQNSAYSDLFGWSSKFSQTERFRVFMEEIDSRWGFSNSISILDVGCGHADLYKYLCQHNKLCQYEGIDFFEDFIANCRKTYPNIPFRIHNLLDLETPIEGNFDIICVSGVLNLNIDKIIGEQGNNIRVLKSVLEKLRRSAKKGILCNFLHARDPKAHDFFCYYNLETLIKEIHDMGYTCIGMRDDYLSNDFTLVIKA